MKHRKTVKKLMALGIQRNDAAGFVSTYNKLAATGKLGALPEVVFEMRPVNPIASEQKKIVSFATRQVISDNDSLMGWAEPERLWEKIEQRMVKELCEGLMRSGLVHMERRRYETYGGCTEFIAKIRVVEP